MSALAVTHLVYGVLTLLSVVGCAALDWHLDRKGASWPTDET
jgi:hypothetical protein